MDLIETKKNLKTYLRFFNKNMDEGNILTLILAKVLFTLTLTEIL